MTVHRLSRGSHGSIWVRHHGCAQGCTMDARRTPVPGFAACPHRAFSARYNLVMCHFGGETRCDRLLMMCGPGPVRQAWCGGAGVARRRVGNRGGSPSIHQTFVVAGAPPPTRSAGNARLPCGRVWPSLAESGLSVDKCALDGAAFQKSGKSLDTSRGILVGRRYNRRSHSLWTPIPVQDHR